jgi:hypothetical protein
MPRMAAHAGFGHQLLVLFEHLRLPVAQKDAAGGIVPGLQRELVGLALGTGIVGEDVVVDVVLPRVVQVHGADLAALDDVAVDVVAAAAFVQINAPGEHEEPTVIVEPDAVGAVVVPDGVPPAAPAAGIGTPGVFHFQVAVADAIVLQGVERPAVKDAAARHVVNQIVRDAGADAAEHHPDAVAVELSDMVDVAVFDHVLATFQFHQVAAADRDAVPADVPDVATADRAVRAAVQGNGGTVEVAQVVNRALFDHREIAVGEANRTLLGAAQFKPADADVVGFGETQDIVDRGDGHHVLGQIRVGRRDQIQLLVFQVLIPFTGSVQFFPHAHDAETVFGACRVLHLCRERDGARRGIVVRDLLNAVPPVVAGKDADFPVLRPRPHARVLGPQDHRVGAFSLDVLVHRRADAVHVGPTA